MVDESDWQLVRRVRSGERDVVESIRELPLELELSHASRMDQRMDLRDPHPALLTPANSAAAGRSR